MNCFNKSSYVKSGLLLCQKLICEKALLQLSIYQEVLGERLAVKDLC